MGVGAGDVGDAGDGGAIGATGVGCATGLEVIGVAGFGVVGEIGLRIVGLTGATGLGVTGAVEPAEFGVAGPTGLIGGLAGVGLTWGVDGFKLFCVCGSIKNLPKYLSLF